jgi:hypothetical protein
MTPVVFEVLEVSGNYQINIDVKRARLTEPGPF